MKNKIKIIIPFYNPGDFLKKCVASVITQDYENFEAIFIDDCSTDGAWNLLPHDKENVICIKNDVRKTALENIHDAIMNHCEKEDIVVLLDGDDWFAKKTSLSFINNFFNENECWIMYGQASWTNGQKGIARPYENEQEFNNMRNKPFYVSHIRCFKAGLYQKIQSQDSDFSCLKDVNGDFYKMTYDVAIMYPIMEMAGYDRTKYNDVPLYVYNKHNPISDDKVNHSLQYSIHQEINRKSKFEKIKEY